MIQISFDTMGFAQIHSVLHKFGNITEIALTQVTLSFHGHAVKKSCFLLLAGSATVRYIGSSQPSSARYCIKNVMFSRVELSWLIFWIPPESATVYQ